MRTWWIRALCSLIAVGGIWAAGIGTVDPAVVIGQNADNIVGPDAAAANDETGSLAESSFSQALDQQIGNWIQLLSEQDGLESWRDADWERYPLGPGMRGWLVLLVQEEEEVGYLVVNRADRDFQLAEYGSGRYPLFSMHMLDRILADIDMTDQQQQSQQLPRAERIYIGAFQAVWKIETALDGPRYYDGVTGELFPLDEEIITRTLCSWENGAAADVDGALTNSHPTERLRLAVFDPFEKLNWVERPPANIDGIDALAEMLESGRLTFAARIFERQVTVPFAVTGYQSWDSGPDYVRVDLYGERFIPLELFQQFGEFYPDHDAAESFL